MTPVPSFLNAELVPLSLQPHTHTYQLPYSTETVGVSPFAPDPSLSSVSSLACAAIDAINPADDALAIPRAAITNKTSRQVREFESEDCAHENRDVSNAYQTISLAGAFRVGCVPPRQRPCSSAMRTPWTPSDSVLTGCKSECEREVEIGSASCRERVL